MQHPGASVLSIQHHIQDRLRYLRIDSDSRAAMASFLPVLKKEIPGLLQLFYGHLSAFPELIAMFGGSVGLERAKASQHEHWLKLFSGQFDDAYLASATRVGMVHSRIGLEPRYYIGSYAMVAASMAEMALKHTGRRFAFWSNTQGKTAFLLKTINQAVLPSWPPSFRARSANSSALWASRQKRSRARPNRWRRALTKPPGRPRRWRLRPRKPAPAFRQWRPRPSS
jgi:hemoglobin-like flavoprotein